MRIIINKFEHVLRKYVKSRPVFNRQNWFPFKYYIQRILHINKKKLTIQKLFKLKKIFIINYFKKKMI